MNKKKLSLKNSAIAASFAGGPPMKLLLAFLASMGQQQPRRLSGDTNP